MRIAAVLVLALGLNLLPFDVAQARQDSAIEPSVVPLQTTIKSVTLYRARASITRNGTLQLQPGIYEVQVSGLPETIQPTTLQARADAGAKVLAVEFVQETKTEATSQQVKALDEKIHSIELAIKDLQHKRELLEAQTKFIEAVSVRAASDASQQAGTDKLDLDALRKQMAFVLEERAKIIEDVKEIEESQAALQKELAALQANRQAIAAGSLVARSAEVTIAVQQPAQVNLDLTYLVANAGWEPTYNVRASLDGSTAMVEYDALLTQRTGEDWDNVKLALSTAQPMLAANPPSIQPWFVDVRRPELQEQDRGFRDIEVARRAALKPEEAGLEKFASDAAIGGSGPSVTFQLPRPVTVHTNSAKQQRTRIATIDTHPKFVYVAVPMLTDAVYIRGELVNASAYQLLPGNASIFLGEDYVGPTTMESVAPNGDFKVHFGIDPAVQASRKLVSKHTETTGLLSGGRRTIYEYRLSIDNGTGKSILVELWDRYPVSRNSEIQIEPIDISAPLSADNYYVTEEKPQGLLKWILNVPPTAAGLSSYAVNYGVQINHAKDIELTPLPE